MENTKENLDVMYFHGGTCDGYKFTIAGIIEDDDLLLGIGICADGENFSRPKGRMISAGRVLNQRDTIKGRSRLSLYSSNLDSSKYGGLAGFPKDYFKGIEIKVFREIVKNYNYFTKKELRQEFHLQPPYMPKKVKENLADSKR